MGESVTLEIAPEVMERARAIATATSQSVEAILAMWITNGAKTEQGIQSTLSGEYEVWSPFDEGNIVSTLRQALDEDRQRRGK